MEQYSAMRNQCSEVSRLSTQNQPLYRHAAGIKLDPHSHSACPASSTDGKGVGVVLLKPRQRQRRRRARQHL